MKHGKIPICLLSVHDSDDGGRMGVFTLRSKPDPIQGSEGKDGISMENF